MARWASRPLAFDEVRGDTDMQTLSDRGFRLKRPAAVTSAHWGMNTEQFEDHPEGWRTLWLAIEGVMAVTLTWNVLMLSLNGISY